VGPRAGLDRCGKSRPTGIHAVSNGINIQNVHAISTKINAYTFVPKRFIKFIFSALYRVTKKVFNARQYTSMWAPVVA
jgi:hypothetical protein